ncbi:aliphatic sulfonate ABC transporter substrate-binding protein [Paenibacillus chondroitinus]|uniref:Aliphatic sulfonate ABC transporter substrate-binding protein n=1 Tax=Paenibacillus chondroitinus TaxID=59842 RepID=A0ABU6D9D1_9BACL|nr:MULTISPECIES: aliphatic sulfonate ABC transporter substrate-binding protein [Paenibacillus]MCY9661148.1 aliphatic sulfonate ABC transporter substrate-binding protein [Paenibacillus anseongense]MEB4793502.1 aliphatic sulfonate ABC transporter substrate-binding protein [Paenibacillus chondroitinus]
MKQKSFYNKSLSFLTIVTLVLLSACGAKTAGAPTNGGTAAPSGTSAAQSSSAAATPAAASKEKVVVNIGIQGKTGVLNFAREKGYFEKAFQAAGAEVKWNEFASGPPHFEAIAAGRLDFGATGGTPLISGQVGGVDFKGIAVTSDGKKGNMIIVPKNSPIKELKDLKGKKVAVAKGSSAYNFLYMAIDKAGLKGDDVKVIQLQPDEARPALDSGAIDAWSIWEPYATTAVYQTGATILVTGEKLNINAPSFLIARTKFTQEHPDLTVLFLKTYEEARKYYVDHQDEIADELSKSQKLDKAIVVDVLKNTFPILSSITPEFAKAHQEQADFLQSVGAINKKLDTSQVLESKFIDQALKK